MASEPITLFANIADPVHAFRALREISPSFEADDDEQNWRKVVVTIGIWPFKKKLVVTHDLEYYTGVQWALQMDGLRGYFSRFPSIPQRDQAIALTHEFKFALGAIADPDFGSNDYRLTIVQILATELEALWFTPSSLRDSVGRVLLATDESGIDPKARWPGSAT